MVSFPILMCVFLFYLVLVEIRALVIMAGHCYRGSNVNAPLVCKRDLHDAEVDELRRQV